MHLVDTVLGGILSSSGGTIAAQAKSNLELTSYDPRYPGTLPKLRPQELLDKVPGGL